MFWNVKQKKTIDILKHALPKKTRKKCEVHDCLFANFMETMLHIFHSKRNLDRKKIVSNFLFTSFYSLSILCGIVSFRTWFYVNQRILNTLHIFIFFIWVLWKFCTLKSQIFSEYVLCFLVKYFNK